MKTLAELNFKGCAKSRIVVIPTFTRTGTAHLLIYYLNRRFYANDLKNLKLKLFQINLVQLNN